MKKIVVAAVLGSVLIGLAMALVSTAQAARNDWVKDLWEEMDRRSGG
jgi:hypothetical protein